MKKTYYRFYLPRASIGELWRLSTNPLIFIVLLTMKLFRQPLPLQFGISTRSETVSLEDVPEPTQNKLREKKAELERLDFRLIAVEKGDTLGHRDEYSIRMLHADRETLMQFVEVRVQGKGSEVVEDTFLVSNKLSTGDFLLTTNNPTVVNLKAPVKSKVYRVDSAEDLMMHHGVRRQQELATSVVVQSEEQFLRVGQELEDAILDQLVDRKLLVPLTDPEIESLEKLDASLESDQGVDSRRFLDGESFIKGVDSTTSGLSGRPPMGSHTPAIPADPNSDHEAMTESEIVDGVMGTMHPEDRLVLQQIHSRHISDSSWVSKLILLIWSLAAFIAIGAFAWNWFIVLLLIPILFLHELGHYVAMRMLKYRDVKMFFLPLFGAAVQGRNHNAPGWQRAVVALAGPLPSLLIASLVLIFADGQRSVLMFGSFMVFINALNLLPFLPLDGGWVIQATVSSRNQYLDFLFRVLAVLAFGYLAFKFGGVVLWIITILMAAQLPAQWRMGALTQRMRRDGIHPEPTDVDELCEPTIYEIVRRVRTETNIPVNTRGQAALGVYELLSARPPGVLATIALLATQAVGLFGSVVFAAWLLMPQFFQPWQRNEMPVPDRPISVADIVMVEPLPADVAERNVVYLNLETTELAKQVHGEFSERRDVVVSRIGQSIVIEYTGKQVDVFDSILERARKYDPDSFSNLDGEVATVALACELPTELDVERVANSIRRYLALVMYEVAAPWISGGLTAEQISARKTVEWLMDVERSLDEQTPVWDAEMEEVYKSRDDAAIRAYLLEKQRERVAEVRQRWESDGQTRTELRRDVFELYVALMMSDWLGMVDDEEVVKNQGQRELMVRYLGGLPDIEPAIRKYDVALYDAEIHVEGRTLKLSYVGFFRLPTGMRALLSWLEAAGATNARWVLVDERTLYK